MAFRIIAANTCPLRVCLLLPQFNAGSAGSAGFIAGQAFLNTNAAAASAMLTFMLLVSGGQGGPV
jgi:hypothetical protein